MRSRLDMFASAGQGVVSLSRGSCWTSTSLPRCGNDFDFQDSVRLLMNKLKQRESSSGTLVGASPAQKHNVMRRNSAAAVTEFSAGAGSVATYQQLS